VKDICQKHEVGSARHEFANLVGVALHEIAVRYSALVEPTATYFEQIAINVDCHNMARCLGHVQGEPPIARAEVDRFHAGAQADLIKHAGRIGPQHRPPSGRGHLGGFKETLLFATHVESFARSRSIGLSRYERVSVDLKTAGALFSARTLKGVNRRSNPDVNETNFFQHFLPGCTRQTTGNSSCP
jgi:hypothetical protein